MAAVPIPFLMFQGDCEAALTLYASVFKDASITGLERWAAGQPGVEGKVAKAALMIAGREFRAFDSPAVHAFTFTPSFSIFVDCDSEAEIEALWGALSDRGVVMMPLGAYGFSKRFGWTSDRFGVSWQLNLD